MAKKQSLQKEFDEEKQKKLLETCQENQTDSESWLSTLRDTWDEKESMLIVRPEDQISQKTSSKVFDPKLSTIVFERSARVMAQNPKGKFYATSEDDIGKNLLMNMLVDHFRKNANEQFSHLIKLRLLDLYSLVYGSMFALVPWRVNKRISYVGPELLILPIRDCFPQGGIRNVNEADYFDVRNVVSIEWLKAQDPSVWFMDNILALDKDLKANKASGDAGKAKKQQFQSYVERTYYPSNVKDLTYPRIETFTEYRMDMWITWAPNQIDPKKGRPYILRIVRNPYPDGMLPIVAKHAFPLLDSPIGLGEFERGKTLQYAINSLWNLYLDGVKFSIFPPLAIDPDNVVPSSIKWGAGEKWFMNNPNRDVQTMNLSPQGLQTFSATYDYLVSSIYSQAGSTNVNQKGEGGGGLGKTPDAIKLYSAAEGARDEWDRFMMEEAIKDIYKRWGALIPNKLETKVTLRLFKNEIQNIQKTYPDVKDLLKYKDGADRGSLGITKSKLDQKYDFDLEAGSTYKPNIESEQQNITSIIRAVTENPVLLPEIRKTGADVDLAELFKRWVVAGGVKDWDKIIKMPVQTSANPTVPGATPPGAVVPPGVVPPQPGAAVPPVEAVPPAETVPPTETVPTASPEFKDPDIANAAKLLFGGAGGIPPAQQ